MTTATVVVPFRDRGIDPQRRANLGRILTHWDGFAEVLVLSDDGSGCEQFNRSKAYNTGIRVTDTDVIVFTESDMLIPLGQVTAAIDIAAETAGLVVPFTDYHYLSESDSGDVRAGYVQPQDCVAETVRTGGVSIGATNVVSRKTLDAIGCWDESFEGSWYDDTAMKLAFEVAAGPTRWVIGPAYHLYHLPGWTGEHLTEEDRAATAANRARLALYERAKTPQRIRELTSGAR